MIRIISSEDIWKTQEFRQSAVLRLEKTIQESGLQLKRDSSQLENMIFTKSANFMQYIKMLNGIIPFIKELGEKKQQALGQAHSGSGSQAPSQQDPNSQQVLTDDPINALEALFDSMLLNVPLTDASLDG